MSAALQLPIVWRAATAPPAYWPAEQTNPVRSEEEELPPPQLDFTQETGAEDAEEEAEQEGPSVSLAFYRKHTESLLRRYLYVSMQVGRTPSAMNEPVERGQVSYRRLRTFEDAVIFVLDVEACLGKLSALERILLNRIVLQEYTQTETADMLGISVRAIHYKLRYALDRMTRVLLDSDLLQFTY
jgi:DNA-directed RNA polymerase specialized sigma24 family protein